MHVTVVEAEMSLAGYSESVKIMSFWSLKPQAAVVFFLGGPSAAIESEDSKAFIKFSFT